MCSVSTSNLYFVLLLIFLSVLLLTWESFANFWTIAWITFLFSFVVYISRGMHFRPSPQITIMRTKCWLRKKITERRDLGLRFFCQRVGQNLISLFQKKKFGPRWAWNPQNKVKKWYTVTFLWTCYNKVRIVLKCRCTQHAFMMKSTNEWKVTIHNSVLGGCLFTNLLI